MFKYLKNKFQGLKPEEKLKVSISKPLSKKLIDIKDDIFSIHLLLIILNLH